MGSSGDLIDAVAAVLGLSKVLVGSYYRYLREAGMVTKGGRGRSAPRMVPKDAAMLLIACGAAGIERDNAARLCDQYGQLVSSGGGFHLKEIDAQGWPITDESHDGPLGWRFVGLNFPRMQALGVDHVLVDALAALIDDIRNFEAAHNSASKEPFRPTGLISRVEFCGPLPLARIEVCLQSEHEGKTRTTKEFSEYCDKDGRAREEHDLRIIRSFSEVTLKRVAEIIST